MLLLPSSPAQSPAKDRAIQDGGKLFLHLLLLVVVVAIVVVCHCSETVRTVAGQISGDASLPQLVGEVLQVVGGEGTHVDLPLLGDQQLATAARQHGHHLGRQFEFGADVAEGVVVLLVLVAAAAVVVVVDARSGPQLGQRVRLQRMGRLPVEHVPLGGAQAVLQLQVPVEGGTPVEAAGGGGVGGVLGQQQVVPRVQCHRANVRLEAEDLIEGEAGGGEEATTGDVGSVEKVHRLLRRQQHPTRGGDVVDGVGLLYLP